MRAAIVAIQRTSRLSLESRNPCRRRSLRPRWPPQRRWPGHHREVARVWRPRTTAQRRCTDHFAAARARCRTSRTRSSPCCRSATRRRHPDLASSQKSSGRSANSGGDVRRISASVMRRNRPRLARPRLGRFGSRGRALVDREGEAVSGGEGRNRTVDTTIFRGSRRPLSPLLLGFSHT